MADLSEVTDVAVVGGWTISADQLRVQILWAQEHGHANCFFQRTFYQETPDSEEKCVIRIYDLFDERWPTKSVTNDAENVVWLAHLAQGNYPMIYRDTEGRWDELRHREGYFACFRSLDTSDEQEAVKKVLALHEQDAASYRKAN